MPVVWTVTAGGGALGGTLSSATVGTDANGHASVSLTLGAAAGVDSVVASLPSASSVAAVTFTETATAAATTAAASRGRYGNAVPGVSSMGQSTFAGPGT